MQDILIGLIELGTVGGGVVTILHNRIDTIRKEQGLPIRLARIVDKNASRFAEVPVGDAVCSTNVEDDHLEEIQDILERLEDSDSDQIGEDVYQRCDSISARSAARNLSEPLGRETWPRRWVQRAIKYQNHEQ